MEFGFYIGEVFVVEFVEYGVSFVEIGYVEWCVYFGEMDDIVVCKIVVVVWYGLMLFFCIGEIVELDLIWVVEVCIL